MGFEGFKKCVLFMGRGGNILGSVGIVVMMLLVCGDVIGRYVLRKPIVGAFELTEFLMAGIIFIGFAYSQAQKAHLKIGLLLPRLPQNAQFFFQIFNLVVTFLFFALIAWRGIVGSWEAYALDDKTPGLVRIPYWPAKAVVPLGAVLLCSQILMDLLEGLQERRLRK
ncbi:MAG: TRAP transporter small permease [Deltaproteobacteria bacterium]|nr:TRAP transporter small permease [Deltaproteobacteria bacterium]